MKDRVRNYQRYEVWRSLGARDYYVKQYGSKKMAREFVAKRNAAAPRCVLYFCVHAQKGGFA